jgi:5-methyltetrahydrofolate--homocysteine methyltransferase
VSYDLSGVSRSVIQGNIDDIAGLTQQAIDAGLSAQEILDAGLMEGMRYVGVEFRAGRLFVPEVLRSARAMQISMDLLKPLLAETGAKSIGTVLLGTVKGDMHDIGKNLVGMMCEGAGFEVKDLGKNIPPDVFVEAIKEHKPDVLGLSALLTTTMPGMERTIRALEAAGIRDRVKIMIGGAPVTRNYATHIGADGYASNAITATELAQELIGRD